jgi:hypothetical protein
MDFARRSRSKMYILGAFHMFWWILPRRCRFEVFVQVTQAGRGPSTPSVHSLANELTALGMTELLI